MEKANLLANLSLLLVDDDEETLRQLQIMLRKKTGKIYTASNGRIGLYVYRDVKPDIIITDLKMPLMDGREMIREVRKTDKEIPVIVTSVYEDVKVILNTVDIGINNYIIKPVDSQRLLDALVESAALIFRYQDSLITSEGIILNRDEKLKKEDELKQVFASMLKNDTGKGPLSARAVIKGLNIHVELINVLTKYELSLLNNLKNTRMVNYTREVFYLDRQEKMENEISRVMNLECTFKDVKADSKENKDSIFFELKIS
jgi:DNA-binding response OmpR family regulator